MKPLGFVLLVMGWVIVLAALQLLPSPASRSGFVFAGLGVEILGCFLIIRSHLSRGLARG